MRFSFPFSTIITLGSRLGVGQQTLNLLAEVRILAPQPSFMYNISLEAGRFQKKVYIPYVKAHSSRGQGHRPLKAEIAGSNPACATKIIPWNPISYAVSVRQPIRPPLGLPNVPPSLQP